MANNNQWINANGKHKYTPKRARKKCRGPENTLTWGGEGLRATTGGGGHHNRLRGTAKMPRCVFPTGMVAWGGHREQMGRCSLPHLPSTAVYCRNSLSTAELNRNVSSGEKQIMTMLPSDLQAARVRHVAAYRNSTCASTSRQE
jgi:hypothetical protein